MTVSGSGSDTNPQNVVWFCHLCRWTGVLPVGEQHGCQPKEPAAGMLADLHELLRRLAAADAAVREQPEVRALLGKYGY